MYIFFNMASDVTVLSVLMQICYFIVVLSDGINQKDVKLVTQPAFTEEHIFFELLRPESIRYSYKVKPAKDFGGVLNRTLRNVRLVPTDPLDSCSALRNAHEVKDTVALVKRGECSFLSKAVITEKAGALAVIVTDNDQRNDERFIDMIQDETSRRPTLPAYFLLGKDGHMIFSTLKQLGLSNAIINIPINITGMHLHHVHQPPWRVW